MATYRRRAARRRLYGLAMALLAVILMVPKFDLPKLPGPMAFLADVWAGATTDRSAG